MRAGKLDFTVDLTPDQLKKIQADANLEAVVRPFFNVGYLGLAEKVYVVEKRATQLKK